MKNTTGSNPTLYADIRDTVIDEIRAGLYPSGALLPSNAQIQKRWKVSSRVSRRVLAELEEAGWATSAGTRGYIAASGPSGRQISAAELTIPDDHRQVAAVPLGPTDSSGHPIPRPLHTVPIHGYLPAELTTVQRVTVTVEPAPPEIAAALAPITPGTPVHVRRRVVTDPTGRVPVELRASYLPDLSPDHPLAQPAATGEPWPAALAHHTPQPLSPPECVITARPADPREVRALALPPYAWVLTRAATTHTTTGQPIDCTLSIWPADHTRVHAAPPA
ncbi:UTRA domain-containing protein [Actinomadura hibisca]|uniref:UTRA domain-containing protein n=1 Tax=Actinomadura hibisca TaxID=68565 RepID=UPI00082F8526|nr:GntR family transcriptional regulator [Actinomadura hibisca]